MIDKEFAQKELDKKYFSLYKMIFLFKPKS